MKSALKTRKIILLAVAAALLAISIVQCAAGAKDNTKKFTLKVQPDELIIENPNGNVHLVSDNGKWFINEQKYPANASSVDNLIRGISELTALEKVGKAHSDNLVRYELTESQKITVTAKKDGQTLRTLELGKDSTTGVQGYAVIDGSSDIYLVSGNTRNTFDRTVDELRSRIVIDLEKTAVASASITEADGSVWAISRAGEGENLVWSASGVNGELDSAKATDFLEGLAMLSTTGWLSENPANGNKVRSIVISTAGKAVTLDIYEVLPADEDGDATYFGRSSETPYPFTMAGYSVQKYLKTFQELVK